MCLQTLVFMSQPVLGIPSAQDRFSRCPNDWSCVDDAFVGEHRLVLENGVQHLEDAGSPLPALMTDRCEVYSFGVLSPPSLLPCARTSASLQQLLLLQGQVSRFTCKREGLLYKLLFKLGCGSKPVLRAGSERVQMVGYG